MPDSLTPAQIIKAVVAYGGRTKLTSEKLGIPEPDIIAAITSDQASLAEQLRTTFLLELYDTMAMTKIAFVGLLDRMSPDVAARAYAAQAAAFATLTSRPSEDATDQPVDIQAARTNLANRLEEHQRRLEDRRTKEAAEE